MPYVDRAATLNYTPGDTLLCANDTYYARNTATYAQYNTIKLITTIYGLSKFRFKFDMRCSSDGGGPVYARIYRNGIAVGTEQSSNVDDWATFSEDINTTNWRVNDTIELWLKGPGVAAVQAENFRIYGAVGPFIQV